MKHIINLIILITIITTQNSVFAQETVLKTFSAPKNTIEAVKITPKTQGDAKSAQTNKQFQNISNTSQTDTCPVATNQAAPLIPDLASRPPAEYIYKESSTQINSIDPNTATSLNSYYPGLRGTNQLVIYTPSYGLRTGTNEFGTEAIVSGNIVIDMNGADSIIPKDGFVISGHGKAKKWINENISVGSKIYVDLQNNKMKTYLTPDSLIFGAKEKIIEANSIMEYYRSIDILYNDKTSSEYICKAKELLRNAEKYPDDAQVYITEATNAANQAILNAIPYRENELKGVWIRPTERSPEEIVRTVEKLKNIGINNIFLETYFHGKTIYPSDVLASYNVTNQREEFVGFDPLRVWVDECHKRNIKVNIWFETFYVGNQPPESNEKNIIKVHPDWANTTKAAYASSTAVASLSEHNGYFIDPANPEVQKYLLSLLNEIITNYHPDGINLDYIRYPQSIAAKFASYDMSNWGYTQYARNEFKGLYGMDPIELKYNNDGWDLWARYRQDKVTKFVTEVKKITSCNNILLTAVVFPDRQKAIETKMQDWRTWSLNNLVDGFTPLILTSDKMTASSMIRDIKANAGPCTKVYAGLFATFMGGSPNDLLLQIQESRKQNANGIIIFDYAHLDQKYIDALKARVYNPDLPCVCPSPDQNQMIKKKRRFKFYRY